MYPKTVITIIDLPLSLLLHKRTVIVVNLRYQPSAPILKEIHHQ